ncbi:MAG: VWA domain-containing protein [Acidobacteria bacterium]|nr:VWA domain-containing protein [Acidobacteriota bacterium]
MYRKLQLLTAAIPALLSAQEPLLFRSTARLVQVNVVVSAGSGAPVTGLKSADFKVFEDGKEQQIRFFSASTTPQTATQAPVEAGGFTNRSLAGVEPAPPVVTVILFDALNVGLADQANARRNIARFLRQIQPQDRVALYVLGESVRILHDFSSDAASLLQKVDRFEAVESTEMRNARLAEELAAAGDNGSLLNLWGLRRENAVLNAQRAERTCKALEAIARRLTGVPGRKRLVWVTNGFPVSIAYKTARSEFEINKESEVRRAIQTLNDASVALYSVHVAGLLGLPGFEASSQFVDPRRAVEIPAEVAMRELARGTGGRYFYNRNDIDNAIRQAADDARSTYTLAYYPANANYDGSYRKIQVRVNSKGAELQYRQGYYAVADSPKARSAQVKEELANPLMSTAIPVDVFLERRGGMLDTTLRIEPGLLARSEPNGEVRFRFSVLLHLTAADGKPLNTSDKTVDFTVPQEKAARLMSQGLSYRLSMKADDAARAMRVIVRGEPDGPLGSLTAPLAKGQ